MFIPRFFFKNVPFYWPIKKTLMPTASWSRIWFSWQASYLLMYKALKNDAHFNDILHTLVVPKSGTCISSMWKINCWSISNWKFLKFDWQSSENDPKLRNVCDFSRGSLKVNTDWWKTMNVIFSWSLKALEWDSKWQTVFLRSQYLKYCIELVSKTRFYGITEKRNDN